MAQLSITARHVAPYVISGATGVHILVRMHRLSQEPAIDIPLHFFLLKNTDVVLALSGTSAVIWRLAQHKADPQGFRSSSTSPSNGSAAGATNASLISGVIHELRQIFTALLLGLGLIRKKAATGQTRAIPALVQRLKQIVYMGVEEVNLLEPTSSSNGHEREHGA